ncbi:hypothetical protein [Nocardia miyunensis]|uniref:hypothetical protein n=1 Tax=Nocardia miyunensis TaxID=282684 RepID=UPI000ABB1BFE|nr:hypothetical protein [Nocardia miyunensis]
MNIIQHISWWARLLTGIVLVLAALIAELANDMRDNDSTPLTVSSVVCGIAGVAVLLPLLV